MITEKIRNDRYPHLVVITRLSDTDNPFGCSCKKKILYKGKGRSYTDTTTTGDAKMDISRRKVSIPVRFDEWKRTAELGVAGLMDGDVIAVRMGDVVEKGIVKDFEPDNNRTVVYWEYGKV